MATHSNILAWRIPWTEEPGGLSHEVTKSWKVFVYRNMIDFCMMILYAETLLNSLMILMTLCVCVCNHKGSPHTWLCHWQTDNFTYSIQILMLFIYFSCLIALARTFKSILNRNSKSWPPSLYQILEKDFSFSSLIIM